jgi:hypothetical protein
LHDSNGTALGENIDSSGFAAYTSGGTAAKVAEVRTPYSVIKGIIDTPPEIKYSQNADVMYLVHRNYLPLKLTRTSHTAWTLKTFVRTEDPFLSLAATKAISAITKAAPGVLTTSSAHGYTTGDLIQIQAIVGMTQLNNQQFYIDVVDATRFSLRYVDGTPLDTTALTTYVSGGTAAKATVLGCPQAVAFNEGRVCYGGTSENPETFYMSRTPSTTTGAPRYDDFTTGADADHALVFTQAPSSSGKVDSIQWFFSNLKFLVAGNFGGCNRIDGGSDTDIIKPTAIRVKPLDTLGVKNMMPIGAGNGNLVYIQRGGKLLRSLEFDYNIDQYVSVDRSLVADHLTNAGIKQLAYQRGTSDVLWCVLDDGTLNGMIFKDKSDVSGWFRVTLGGTGVSVLSIGIYPRSDDFDQVWLIVERTIDGVTRRYVEYFDDPISFPVLEDFFTLPENATEDTQHYQNRMFELQKLSKHVDASVTVDGSARGDAVGATLTPGAVTGLGVTFTASASVFVAADVGNELWIRYMDGSESGRAKIVSYVNAGEVTCDITQDFNSTDAVPRGEWFITFRSISGLDHLEGEDAQPVCDGKAHPVLTVTDGAITLDYETSYAHIGLAYKGVAKTLDIIPAISGGLISGKIKVLQGVRLGLTNSVGLYVGNTVHSVRQLIFQSTSDIVGRPPPLFTGDKEITAPGGWGRRAQLVFLQLKPYPCTINQLSVDPLIEEPIGE